MLGDDTWPTDGQSQNADEQNRGTLYLALQQSEQDKKQVSSSEYGSDLVHKIFQDIKGN